MRTRFSFFGSNATPPPSDHPSKRRPRELRGRRRQLLIEPLEDRRMLANFLWQGDNVSPNWTVAANWQGGVAPTGTTTDVLVFDTATLGFNSATGGNGFNSHNNFAANTTFQEIVFNSSGFTLSGNAFHIRGTTSIQATNTSGTNTINLAVNLDGAGGSGADHAFDVASGGTLAIGGVISNSGNQDTLTKTGGGTLRLSGSNTYTTTTTVSAGTLQLGAAGNATNTPLGTAGSGTTVSSGAVLDLNGFTLGAAEALTLNGTGLASGGALTNSSATAASYSGLITLGSTSSIVTNAGDLNVTNAGTITGATFGLTVGGNGDGSLSSSLGTSSGTLTKSGSGTWTVSGASTYTGLTTISAGTLKLGAAGGGTNTPLGRTSAGTSVTAGAALDLNGFTLGTAEALTLNGTGISGGGALTNSSATAASFSGLITLGSTSSIVTNAGDLNVTNAGTITGATFGLAVGGNGDGSLSSILGTSSGTLTKSGSGTWTVSGASTYTGLTTISAGTLKLGAAGGGTNTPLGRTGAGTSVTAGAALDLNGFTLGTAEALTLNGTGISGGGALTNSSATGASYSGLVTLGGTASVVASAGDINLTNTGTITGSGFGLTLDGTSNGSRLASSIGTGAGALTKSGSGTWTLSGLSTYSGATIVSEGRLKNGAHGTLPASTALTINGTGIYDPAGYSQTVGSLSDGGVSTGTLTDSGAANVFTVNEAGTHAFSGVISGNLILTKSGAGTLILSGANNYSGLTTIRAGTLQLGAAGDATNTPLGTTASGTSVTGGAVLDLNGFTLGAAESLTLNGTGISDSGALTNSSGTATTFSGLITLGSASSIATNAGDLNLTNAGAIAGATFGLTLGGSGNGSVGSIIATVTGTVTKTGAGTWTLSGTNTYTGTTTIDSGTLLVTGATASGSAVSVNAHGTLGGTGTVHGAIAVSSGGQLTPGTTTGSVGTLNTGGVALVSEATLVTELNGPSNYDALNVTGAVDLTGGTLNLVPGFTPAANSQFTIIANDGTEAIAGTLRDVFGNTLNEGRVLTAGGRRFQISYVGGTGNDVVLTYLGTVTVSFAVATSQGSEGTSPAQLTVQLSHASPEPVTVQYAVVGGSAAGGGLDYTLNSGVLTLAVGVTSQAINIAIVDDALLEPSESIIVELSSPINAMLGTMVRQTYEILDNDQPYDIHVWDGGSTVDSNWTTPENWVGDIAPTGNPSEHELLEFPGSAARQSNINDIASGTFIGLSLQGGGYSLSGNAISLGVEGIDMTATSGTNTVSLPVTMTADSNWSVVIGATLTVSGTVQNGGFTLTTAPAGTMRLSGAISGTGGLTDVGSGRLALSGDNSYDGLTMIDAGTLVASHSQALGSTAGATQVEIGSVLQLSGGISVADSLILLGTVESVSGSNTWSGPVMPAGTVQVDSGVSFNMSGSMTGAGTLAKTGAGTLTLSGTGDNASLHLTADAGTVVLAKTSGSSVHAVAGLTVGGAAVQLGGSGNDQIADNATVAVNSGVLDLAGTSEIIGTLNGSGGTIRNDTSSSTSTLTVTVGGSYAGVITDHASGTGLTALVMADTNGSLTLSGANTYTGATSVTGGTLRVGGDFANDGTFHAGTGTVQFTKSLGTQTLLSGGTGAGFDFANIVHSGAGTLQLVTNALTTTGVFTNSQGTFDIHGQVATLNRLILADGTVSDSGGGYITSSQAYDVRKGTLRAKLSGGAGLNKTTSDTATLEQANDYTGTTEISSGVLEVTTNDALGTNAAGTVLVAGTLRFRGPLAYSTAEAVTINDAAGAIESVAGDVSFAGAIALGATATIQSSTAGRTLTLAGTVSGPGQDLTVAGAGHVTWAAPVGSLVSPLGTINLTATPGTVQFGGQLYATGLTQADTAGSVTFADDVILGGGGGTFAADVVLEGLTLISAGNLTFGSAGGSDALQVRSGLVTIDTTGASDGTVIVNSVTTLNAALTVAGHAIVNVKNTIDGGFALSLTAPTSITVDATLGGGSQLASVALDSGSVDLNHDVSTNGGLVRLGGTVTIDLAANATIATTPSAAGGAGGAVDVQTTGTGTVNLAGAVLTSGAADPGGAGGAGGPVTIDVAGNTLTVGSITTSGGVAGFGSGGDAGPISLTAAGGSPRITLNGNLTAQGGNGAGGRGGAGGAVTLNENVLLGASVAISSLPGAGGQPGLGGNVSLANGATVDAAVAEVQGLTITAGSGDVLVSGAVGASQRLAFLTITGSDVSVNDIGPDTSTAGVSGAISLTATTAGSDIASLVLTGMNYIGTGAIALQVSDSAASGEDLTVPSGVTVRSTGSTLDLRAGDAVTIRPSSTVQALGWLTIAGDYGNQDPGSGTTMMLSGTVASDTKGVVVTGSTDNDSFTIDSSGGVAPGDVSGVKSNITIAAGGGIGDRLTLEDRSATANSILTLDQVTAATSGRLGAGLSGPDNFFAAGVSLTYTGLENVTLNLGTGNDTVDLGSYYSSLATTNFTINAGVVGSADSDTVKLNFTGVTVPLVIAATAAGSATAAGYGLVSWSHLEAFSFQGLQESLTVPNGALYVQGTAGNDVVVFDGTAGAGFFVVKVGGTAYPAAGTFSSITGTLIGYGLNGTDNITVRTAGATTNVCRFYGGAGDDYLAGASGNDYLDGGAGNNTIYGYGGNDTILVTGSSGSNHIDGGLGGDTITGGAGADTIHGGAGNDFIRGGAANDVVYADSGNDVLLGEDGNDTLYGTIGSTGADNRCVLIGGNGADRLYAGAGDLMIANRTNYDSNNAALKAVMARWTSTVDSDSVRQAKIKALGLTTVAEITAAADYLYGSANVDWFWYAAEDRCNGLVAGTDLVN